LFRSICEEKLKLIEKNFEIYALKNEKIEKDEGIEEEKEKE